MIRTLIVPIERLEFSASDPDALSVKITHEVLEHWCLLLCLLHFDLVGHLALHAADRRIKLRICRDSQLEEGERAIVFGNRDNLEVRITATELEHWLHFFLTYYRDGVASVDNIDVDLDYRMLQGKALDTLAFNVDWSIPPVSAEEARRRLGL